MTVLIVENTPDKVRGLLKRWFVEPKSNVFVGSINRRTREKVLQYILKYAPPDLAILAIFDDVNSQGFSIRRYHDTSRIERLITGHYLIATRPEHVPEDGLRESGAPEPDGGEAGSREPDGSDAVCAGELASNGRNPHCPGQNSELASSGRNSHCPGQNSELEPSDIPVETKGGPETLDVVSREKEDVPDPEVIAKTLEILKPCLVFYSLKK